MIFLVKHTNNKVGKAFFENEYIELVSDPLAHAKAEAMEYFYEGYKKGEAPRPVIKQVNNTIMIGV